MLNDYAPVRSFSVYVILEPETFVCFVGFVVVLFVCFGFVSLFIFS